MTNTDTIAAIESAIVSKANVKFTGLWSVNAGDGYVQLVWTCDEDAIPKMYGDEPWSEWGGNEIIAAAGLGEPDDSGCDGGRDQYGDNVVSQWAQWNIETE